MNKYKIGLGDERFTPGKWFGEIILTLLTIYTIHLFLVVYEII